MNGVLAYDAVNRVWTTKAMLPLVGQSEIPHAKAGGRGWSCALVPARSIA